MRMEKEQTLQLASRIESVLFFKTEPVSRLWIAKLLDEDVEAVTDAIKELQEYLENEKRGIVLIEHDASVMLATHPTMGEVVERLQTREIKSDLSKAAVETLAIILYKKEATKQDIDYIRGVNAQFMLRNLMVRGLIERREHGSDKRRSIYIPSHDTLAFLGITDLGDLPGRDILSTDLEQLITEHSDMFGVTQVESQANETEKNTSSQESGDKNDSEEIKEKVATNEEENEQKREDTNKNQEKVSLDNDSPEVHGNEETPVMV